MTVCRSVGAQYVVLSRFLQSLGPCDYFFTKNVSLGHYSHVNNTRPSLCSNVLTLLILIRERVHKGKRNTKCRSRNGLLTFLMKVDGESIS